MTEQENRQLVDKFWDALAARDFSAVASNMGERAHYIDVPMIGVEEGAYGPAETEARLRLGLEPLETYELHPGRIVAQGDLVVTEHAETWGWEPGVSVRLPFTSVMEVRGGRVERWWDYFDLSTLMNAAPPWWVEHVMKGYK
jgi:limonene-1,2-epoxide hydrolase